VGRLWGGKNKSAYFFLSRYVGVMHCRVASHAVGCTAVVAVYDVTDKNSFEKVEKWIEDCTKLAGSSLKAKWLVGMTL
jgi:hypothetical protein